MPLPQQMSRALVIAYPLSADPPCILGTLRRQEMKSCNVSWGCCGNQVAKIGHPRKCPPQLLLHPDALFRQFNSSTPDALLCTALASSGKGGQEARRAFAQVSHCTHSHTAHCLFACFTLHTVNCTLHCMLHICTLRICSGCHTARQCSVCSVCSVLCAVLRVSHYTLHICTLHIRTLHICSGCHTAC